MARPAAKSARVGENPAPVAEEWRPIPGHPGYEASSLGRLRSVDRVLGDGRRWRGRVLRQRLRDDGYPAVSLALGRRGEYRTAQSHILIAESFHGAKPTPEHEGAHGDGIRTNNRADNLRWATAAENAADRARHGMTFEPKGSLHPMAKADEDAVAAMRVDRAAGVSVAELARRHQLSRWAIYDALSGRTWGHV